MQQCPSLGVILFDSRMGRSTQVWVNNLTTTVLYWRPSRGVPELILASFKAKVIDEHLVLGGSDQLLSAYNAAIGRRLCPACYENGIEAPVTERGQNRGVCSHCGDTVDYIISSYSPYFFYFSHQGGPRVAGGKLEQVSYDTHEQAVCDEMKAAMVDDEPRDLILPSRVTYHQGDAYVNMSQPGYITPLTFDLSQSSLKGQFGKTVYDLAVTV